MPTPRGAPTRASQRRNSLQDDAPARTRAARGGKSAPSKPEPSETVPPKPSPTKLSPAMTRKTTRSASNISGNSFDTAPEIYASYEHPLFMVFGLSPEFFNGLKKHHGKLPKERKVMVSAFSQRSSSPEEASETEEESEDESEIEVPTMPPAARGGRGRGRGGRGGRARGGRARGRGGRGRGGLARAASPARSRLSRNASSFPMIEEDEDQRTNQTTHNSTAKPPNRLRSIASGSSDDEHEHAIDSSDESSDEIDDVRIQVPSTTPRGSPPDGLLDSILDGTYVPRSKPDFSVGTKYSSANKLSVPKISLSSKSTSHTPLDSASTPTESAVPKLLAPEDDELSDSDLPEPFIYDAPSPLETECEDRADYLLQTRFDPMVDVQNVIATLTKYAVNQRSTESLFALAANTQKILKAWQDEYLMLDTRTAPHMHPPKKPCNGGRIPQLPEIFEDMKEADLYGYNYDPKKHPGCQDPWTQRPGAEKTGRRELRTRRARDLLDSAAPSEEENEEDEDGRPSKRQRRATRKFDGTETAAGSVTPKKHNGWGGARKKGVSRFAKPTSETPDPEERPAKRARTAASNLLHQRIQEMREESVLGSSGDEGSSAMDVDEYSDVNPKRGRPAGSKNVARRSDFGVKKGPRKKTSEAGTPDQGAASSTAPPQALNSMSEGQGQFTVDPQQHQDTTLSASNATEAVGQAAPQVTSTQEIPLMHPNESSTPDAYMITAPLSQYTGNYAEDSSPASGSRRKPRVKSEKRSQSMTIWWAERKARKREQDEKDGRPMPASASRSNSATRKFSRVSGGSASGATPQSQPESQQASPVSHVQHHPPPPEAYHPHYAQHPPPPGQPAHYMYVSGPPPHHMMMQYSPLAALPSGPFPGYSGPPPPNPQYGARALAPAPVQLQHPPTYPSPYGHGYGPQSPAGPRPQSSAGQQGRGGPLHLAPAPTHQHQHHSPYAPMDRPFKVMIPGPAPAERRESR